MYLIKSFTKIYTAVQIYQPIKPTLASSVVKVPSLGGKILAMHFKIYRKFITIMLLIKN